jgi:FkbM family methyltransferase
MNFGGSDFVAESGELWVIDRIGSLRGGQPQIVFDVGANVGDYASQVLERFESGVRIFAFEPSRRSFEHLSARLEGKDGVQLFNIGFGDNEEVVPLYSTGEASPLASVYDRPLDHVGLSMTEREDVRITRLDDFCHEEGIAHIDLLKLDVEGHELKALQGAAGLIEAGGIDFIQFEFGGANIDSRTYFRDFFELLHERFNLYRILGDGLAPIERYEEALEIFVTVNYLAESKALPQRLA